MTTVNNISSCDDNRLRLAQEAEESLDLGRKLVEEGKYKEALKPYLFAFDNGRCVNGWGGVRLSYIPSEIAQLGIKYPPALYALRERRDAREKLIQEGHTEYDIVSEWISINRYLRENERMLAMLDKVGKEIRIKIINENFDQLLDTKQYKLAAEVLNERGRSFFSWEFHYETEKYFPRMKKHPHYDQKEIVESHRDIFRQRGLKIFELALASRKTTITQEVSRRLLLHCESVSIYTDLLNIAKSIGTKTTQKQLWKEAKAQLLPNDFDQLKKQVET